MSDATRITIRDEWFRTTGDPFRNAACGMLPRSQPIDDPAAAVAAAVAHPLEFPSIGESIFRGDRVVLALDRGVARSNEVIAGIVHCLLESEVQAEDITILRAEETGCCSDAAMHECLPETVRDAIHIITHDPRDEDALRYLAASQDGAPIYFHGSLCDADVVIPISALRLSRSPGYVGINGGLYPVFGNEDAQKRFRRASFNGQHAKNLWEEADEAAWLLGTQFTVQIVPGAGDAILEVIAGETNAVFARGAELCQSYWEFEVPQRASLVVATIEGGPEQQTWGNLARALYTASQAVHDDGAIVLCTDLECQPGPAMQRLCGVEEAHRVLEEIDREREPDAIPAALLCATQERARVYLLSNLESGQVEDLGIAPVSSVDEIERLTRQHESCILVANAHHAVPAST